MGTIWTGLGKDNANNLEEVQAAGCLIQRSSNLSEYEMEIEVKPQDDVKHMGDMLKLLKSRMKQVCETLCFRALLSPLIFFVGIDMVPGGREL